MNQTVSDTKRVYVYVLLLRSNPALRLLTISTALYLAQNCLGITFDIMTLPHLALISSNLCMLSCGISFAWAFPSLFALEQVNNPLQHLWIILSYYIGGIMGSICCNYLLNAVGRKWSLLIATITGMVGWMMIAFATSKQVFAVGRYMAGISTSFGYISAIIYVGETSPANVRGISTSTLIIAANIGMYIKWTISSYLPTTSMALVSSIAPILLLLSISWAPESPYFLMQRGKHLEAILSLVALRKSTDVGEEADTIERSVKTDLANTRSLCGTGNRKALITVLSLMVIEQWSGQMILWDTFISITNISSGTLGIVKIIFIFLGIFAMDSYGRRPLLTLSSLGISVSTFLIGLFFVFQNNQTVVTEMPWLPTMGVVLYLMMCAFGLATLPFTMMSEVFPMNIKIDGSGISMLSRVCCMCILEFFFPFITYRYGIHVMCWIFSIISLWSALFVYWYTPETMGKTLQEVQDLLHKRTSL